MQSLIGIVAVAMALSAPPVASPSQGAAAAGGGLRGVVLNLGIPLTPPLPPLPAGSPRGAGEGAPEGGAIGSVILADDIRAVLPELIAAGVDVVVLRVNAGMEFDEGGRYRAGSAAETEELVELIINELNPRFRTVAWVESALDTAAVAAWACEDLCLMSTGTLGGAVLEAGPMLAAEGEELAAWLRLGERASRASGREAAVMRSMQGMTPLSVTRGVGGAMAWSNDTTGAEVVNEPGHVLTLSGVQAERLGISMGTADGREELARVLGVGGITWVAEGAGAAVDRAQRSRAGARPE